MIYDPILLIRPYETAFIWAMLCRTFLPIKDIRVRHTWIGHAFLSMFVSYENVNCYHLKIIHIMDYFVPFLIKANWIYMYSEQMHRWHWPCVCIWGNCCILHPVSVWENLYLFSINHRIWISLWTMIWLDLYSIIWFY